MSCNSASGSPASSGRSASRGSSRMRSPASQRASCSARRSVTRESRGCRVSGMVAGLQSELGRHAVQGPGELLAEGARLAADPRGDLGPFQPQGAVVCQQALLVAEQLADLVEQVAAGDDPARLGGAAGQRVKVAVGLALEAALVALLGLLPAGAVLQLV